MIERTKLILGGLWVLLLNLGSFWLLSLFQDEYHYSVVGLVFVFAWLSGLQFSSWFSWLKEYTKSKKVI